MGLGREGPDDVRFAGGGEVLGRETRRGDGGIEGTRTGTLYCVIRQLGRVEGGGEDTTDASQETRRAHGRTDPDLLLVRAEDEDGTARGHRHQEFGTVPEA